MSLSRTAVLSLLLAGAAFSQTASSLIQGIVTDNSGAVVPQARISAVMTGTDATYTTVTNADGNFVLPSVRPGVYSIAAEHPSFRKALRSGVLIEINQRARVDLVLQVGDVKETVSVSADTTTVDTFSASINEVVDSRRIVDLPLNGRQALQLQALLPGAIVATGGQPASLIALNTNLAFAINGSRASASSYSLDGGLNMDMYNNLPTAFPNPDALQEFSILENNYSAAYGRDAGAVVNMVTKSGSNDYHGTVYEFLRNDVLNTRNFFAVGKPPLRKNQFGANLGGPIVHDRTFLFLAYEGNRERRGITNSGSVVPTALERQGDFSQTKLPAGRYIGDPNTVTPANLNGTPFPNNIIPAGRLDPVALKFASDFLPLPNSAGNTLSYNLSIPYTDDQFVGRFDHNLSDRSRLMLRYFYDDNRYLNNDALLAFNSAYDWATHSATLSHTFTLSPTTNNIATFTFNRNTFIRSPLATGPDKNWASLGCVSCVELHPTAIPTDWNISVNNGVGIRSSTAFFSYMQNFQFIDTLSKSVGNHLFTMGGDIAKVRRNGREYFDSAPVFSFDGSRSGSTSGYADFFLGVPLNVVQNTILQSWTGKWTPALYFQDDWKISRRLTLNLGVRWSPFLTVTEKNNRLAAFRPGEQSKIYPTAPTGLVFPGDAGIDTGIVPPRWNHFEPRFGFAWDPFGDGKTSVRGGYGVFFDTLRLVAINGQPTRQPFSVGTTLSNPFSLSNPYLGNQNIVSALLSYVQGVPPGATNYQFLSPVTANSIDPNFTTGYMQQWNFNVQRDLWKGLVVTGAYVGSKGTKFQILEQANPAPYIPGQSTAGNIDARRIHQPFGLIEQLEANGNSTYHSFQLSWKKRFAAGYSILGSYVFSKFIDMVADDGHGATSPSGTDPFNWFYDRGISDYNVTHRFVTSFIWEVPILRNGRGWRRAVLGGWQLNGIVTLQSGAPFSVIAGTNRSLTGGAGDRADLLGPVATYGGRPRGQFIQKYFDTSMFALPALGTYGTAGRNILTGPGLANFDAAAFKNFRVTERKTFEFRWEVFNTLNRPNFGNPTGSFTSPNFGRITTAKDPRIMQAALKFIF